MKVSYPTDDVINIDHPFGNSLQNGFFPIGFYHCWHGGVHIEGKGKAIKAIADGKVIAFRYNKEEIKVGTKDGKPITLSNNFVLMRHDYISGSHTLTFYSLYYHLYFGEETKAEEKPAPPQEEKQKEKKYKAVPAINGGYKLSGIWSIDETVFFPTLTTLNIKEEKEDYYVVSGKDINSIYQTEVHIPKTYGNEKKPTIDKDKVKWTNIAYKGQKGILLYYTEGESKIARKAIAINSDIIVKDEEDPNWIEILYEGQSCFLKKIELENRKLKEEEVEVLPSTPKKTSPKKNNNFPPFLQNQKLIDEVQTCDIAVSAGELIGYVGKQGIYNQPDYYAAHLEVFTPGNYNKVNEKGEIIDRMGMYQFIHNIKNDKYIEGAGQKHFFECEEGDTLDPYMKINFFTPMYCKDIEIDILENGNEYVRIQPKENVKEVDRYSMFLPTSFIKDGKHYWIYLIPKEQREKFWIEKTFIEKVKKQHGREVWVLKSEIPHVYLSNPEKEDKFREDVLQRFPNVEFRNTLSKKVLVDLRNCKQEVFANKKYIYIKSHYYEKEKKIYGYGWIPYPEQEKLFSAHCWNKFGFKIFKKEDYRVYPVKEVNNCEGSSELIKEVLKITGTDRKNSIQERKLKASYNSPNSYGILSRLVCQHQSEWSYDWNRIKTDIETILKYEHPEFSSSQIQQSLDDSKKVFNATYTFWEKLKDKLSGQDKTFFKEGVFWYFEPFAWVTQMKKIFSKDIDLRPLMEFEHQKRKDDCNETCKRIMGKMGVKPEGAGIISKKYPFSENKKPQYECYYQLADENEARTQLIFRDSQIITEANNYLDKALEYGHPILVGVNHTFNYKIGGKNINETTTDHYVVIVGRKNVNGQLRYIFWDVGTPDGASTEWYFIKQDNGTLFAPKTFKKGNKPFLVTQIRRNLDEKGKVIK
ncbi:hypothetical protein, partial [Capnocytophaga sputigena]|uniref:hypothetical protein n=1 Tax=Capnocytophaga sputigena TaxID=1019 RepID=UPI00288B519C